MKERPPGTDYDFENDPFENFKDDQELSAVTEKIYIYRNCIGWLDTVHKVKEKVCDSIGLATRFPSNFLTPSRTYMWSEYYTLSGELSSGQVIDRIMLGSKWIKKSDLWNIKVDPKYTIQDYIDLTKKNIIAIDYAYKKHGGNIKREDEELMVLQDYRDYISHEEIFMTDIYSQINKGTVVPAEKMGNLINTFIRVYFPTAVADAEQIMEYLADAGSGGGEAEVNKMAAVHKTLRENLSLEREVDSLLDSVVKIPTGLQQAPSITQAVVQLQTRSSNMSLGKIFESFMLTETYPYIRLHMPHEEPVHKIFKFTEGLEFAEMREYVGNLREWTTKGGFGITIKALIKGQPDQQQQRQYLTVSLAETGRIIYRIHYKEVSERNLDSVTDSHSIVNALLQKINGENDAGFVIPDPKEYGFVFINGIMKIGLSKASFLIDHNDMSDFARYFFPYVSVVVDPKKRIGDRSRTQASSGKWGTYLRFKKVSNYDDPVSILRRVMYYTKNFEVNEAVLTSVIEAEFNIPAHEARQYIHNARNTMSYKQKAIKLKKLDPAVVTRKQKGIAIEIQGKTPDAYKVRIVGARTKYHFDQVIRFLSRFFTLYEETYFTRIKSRAHLQKRLLMLTNVAKRRNLVMDVVVRSEEDKEAYHAIKRIKKADPERFVQSTDNYTRSCQNSGKLIRRPQQVMNEASLRSLGYKFDARRNVYFRIVTHPRTKKKSELLAVRFEGADGPIFYVCDPKINRDRMYVGILSKSAGTMPCCFHKRQDASSNPLTRRKYLESVGIMAPAEEESKNGNTAGNVPLSDHTLYIKNFSEKISHERYHFLPEVLDFWMNQSLGRRMVITSKLESTEGYFFLYGVVAEDDRILRTLSYALGSTPESIRARLVQALREDAEKGDRLFTSLGDGSTRISFQNIEAYIKYLTETRDPDTALIIDLVAYLYHLNVIIFDPIKEGDFVIRCHNRLSDDHESLMLVKGIGGFAIICEVVKKREDFRSHFLFPKGHDALESVRKYYNIFCHSRIEMIDVGYYTRLGEEVVMQFLDSDYRVRFLLTVTGKILPTAPSGASPDIEHKDMGEIQKHTKPARAQLKDMEAFPWIVPNSLLVNQEKAVVFIKAELVTQDNLQDHEVMIPVTPGEAPNDASIIIPHEEYTPMNPVTDEEMNKRKVRVNMSRFKDETYQRFRIALSSFLSTRQRTRRKIIRISQERAQRPQMKQLLEDALPSFVYVEEDPDWATKRAKELVGYRVLNIRSSCSQEQRSLHCHKKRLMIPREWVPEFIGRVTVELADMGIPGKEILKMDDFLVSEVIDTMSFSNHPNQIMVRGASINLKSVVTALFGHDTSLTDVIGDVTRTLGTTPPPQPGDDRYPLVSYEGFSVQTIIANNYTMLRGCINGFYYLTNRKRYPQESLNLGYAGTAQTVLTNFFRGKIVSWLKTHAMLYGKPVPLNVAVKGPITTQTLIEIQKDVMSLMWKLEMWSFHHITKIPIAILSAEDGNLTHLFQDGNLVASGTYDPKTTIVLRVALRKDIPQGVDVIYQYE